MALTAVDRTLVQRCLNHEPGAWNDFVDRFLGLIYHVVHHTAYLRSMPLRAEDTEDLAADILLQIVAGDYAVLRQFRGQRVQLKADGKGTEHEPEEPPKAQIGLENLEEVQKLLKKLPSREREVVRLCYLEGRSYEEISTELNIPVNTIGPILSRARKRLRRGVINPPPPPPSRPQTEKQV